MISRLASLKFVAVLGCFLALAACSKKNTPDLNAGTGPGAAAVPGSEQDFTVNVGDRVFFLEDQSTLSGEANLLVLPNIDAANISYNLLKTAAGGGIAIGPVLLGAAKPAHILTPSATVRRIVNMTALTVADANAAR